MKRMIAFTLALLLLCTAAAAETVTLSVWADDGCNTFDVVMEIYESPLGVSMAYDPAYFAPDAQLPDTLRFTDVPGAFISFQANSGMTTDDLAYGLALQSGTDECTVDTAVIGGLLSEELEVQFVNYAQDDNGTEYQHTFFLAQRSKDTLLIECYYPTMLGNPVGAEFTAMMQTIVVTDAAPVAAQSSTAQSRKVQCAVCGNWFEEGNEFRNHICISYPAESSTEAHQMVQCDICGNWYEEGNEFRNHACISYPAESSTEAHQMVQCDICGNWYEEGNEFRNHICISYPAEDNDSAN